MNEVELGAMQLSGLLQHHSKTESAATFREVIAAVRRDPYAEFRFVEREGSKSLVWRIDSTRYEIPKFVFKQEAQVLDTYPRLRGSATVAIIKKYIQMVDKGDLPPAR